MLDKLSEKFAEKLIQTGVISESDADVYSFGFFQTVMLILNVTTTLALGLAFQLFIPCIVLNLAYIPIRICAGGHHADSPIKCYIYSTLDIAILLSILKWIPIHFSVTFISIITAGVIIFILSPVETENNPLDEVEKCVYRKRTLFVLLIEIIVYVFFLIFFRDSLIISAIALGLFTEALMLVAGVFKNNIKKQRDVSGKTD